MNSRYVRLKQKEKHRDIGIDSFIERIKKMRALNCDPIDIGMDSYLCRRLFSGRSNSLTKFI